MQHIFLFLFLFLASHLNAQILTSPIDAIKSIYPESTKIVKKNIMVNRKNASIISQEAKAKLPSKIFRVFKAYKNEDIIAYGILVSKKVRSKNAVTLYIISKDSILEGIEVIAFNEPIEYLPSKTWNKQFENVPTNSMLRSSKEIPTITGATLSAQSITNGSRIAFAFYNTILKGK